MNSSLASLLPVPPAWEPALRGDPEAAPPVPSARRIGGSHQGRALWGIVAGSGPLRVSITAGAHADEPVGPRAAALLADALAGAASPRARRLARLATFHIVPHANPDGGAANEPWALHFGDFAAWLRLAVRDPPGLDVEFNYPRDEHDAAARPENLAIARFLREAGGPFDVHLSLHSMAFAEGAWMLIDPAWIERTASLRARLARAAAAMGLGLHDVDRRGEKGFHRIAPGFATTPSSVAMAAYFRELGDEATAGLFRPSSMEFVRSLGGEPLCLVTECPNFEIAAARGEASPLGQRPHLRLRDALPAVRVALLAGDRAPVDALVREFQLTPVDRRRHAWLQLRTVEEAVLLRAAQ